MKLCIALTGIVPKQSLIGFREDYNDYSDSSRIYPRTGDLHLDCIFELLKSQYEIGEFTIYNDFCHDPGIFKGIMKYALPLSSNQDRLIIGNSVPLHAAPDSVQQCEPPCTPLPPIHSFVLQAGTLGMRPDYGIGIIKLMCHQQRRVWIEYEDGQLSWQGNLPTGDGAIMEPGADLARREHVPSYTIVGERPAR